MLTPLATLVERGDDFGRVRIDWFYQVQLGFLVLALIVAFVLPLVLRAANRARPDLELEPHQVSAKVLVLCIAAWLGHCTHLFCAPFTGLPESLGLLEVLLILYLTGVTPLALFATTHTKQRRDELEVSISL